VFGGETAGRDNQAIQNAPSERGSKTSQSSDPREARRFVRLKHGPTFSLLRTMKRARVPVSLSFCLSRRCSALCRPSRLVASTSAGVLLRRLRFCAEADIVHAGCNSVIVSTKRVVPWTRSPGGVDKRTKAMIRRQLAGEPNSNALE